MRELKFRAWDKTNKEMLFAELDELYGGELDRGHHFTDWGNVMQYTGLKDKNEKEIYEGDILEMGDNYPCEVKYDSGSCKYQAHEYGNRDGERVHEMDAYTVPWKVIGNIYENPELLKSEKVKKYLLKSRDSSRTFLTIEEKAKEDFKELMDWDEHQFLENVEEVRE